MEVSGGNLVVFWNFMLKIQKADILVPCMWLLLYEQAVVLCQEGMLSSDIHDLIWNFVGGGDQSRNPNLHCLMLKVRSTISSYCSGPYREACRVGHI